MNSRSTQSRFSSQEPAAPRASSSDAPVPLPDTGIWTVPASILAGSLIVGLFQPWALVAGVAALIWLGSIHSTYRATLAKIAEEQRVTALHIRQAQDLSKKTAAILDTADVPIISTDNSGRIVQANAAAGEILGSGRVLIDEYFDSLITQMTVKEIEYLARSGESGHARLELPAAGSMRVFHVAAEPIPDGQGAVCTFTDITELSASVTLKADFAANASHELRTPIAAILGAIQTIEGSARNDPKMSQRLVTMISTNATRLDLMVKDLLDLSKLENPSTPTEFTVVPLHEIIERSSSPFAGVCERRGLTIKTTIDPAAAYIRTDASLLELILRNLIGNATKFAHEHTTITLHVDPVELEFDPALQPPIGLDGRLGVRIGVRDEGIGIPLSQQARIFERFYQVDEARSGSSARRGTGLGLAIVKHAVRTLGGGIRVKSVHQEGTTMVIELPHCITPGIPTPAANPEANPDANPAANPDAPERSKHDESVTPEDE